MNLPSLAAKRRKKRKTLRGHASILRLLRFFAAKPRFNIVEEYSQTSWSSPGLNLSLT